MRSINNIIVVVVVVVVVMIIIVMLLQCVHNYTKITNKYCVVTTMLQLHLFSLVADNV